MIATSSTKSVVMTFFAAMLCLWQSQMAKTVQRYWEIYSNQYFVYFSIIGPLEFDYSLCSVSLFSLFCFCFCVRERSLIPLLYTIDFYLRCDQIFKFNVGETRERAQYCFCFTFFFLLVYGWRLSMSIYRQAHDFHFAHISIL